jgi:hypothetical protein
MSFKHSFHTDLCICISMNVNLYESSSLNTQVGGCENHRDSVSMCLHRSLWWEPMPRNVADKHINLVSHFKLFWGKKHKTFYGGNQHSILLNLTIIIVFYCVNKTPVM